MQYSELKAGQGIILEHSAGEVRIHALKALECENETACSQYSGYLAAGFENPDRNTVAVTYGVFLLDFVTLRDDDKVSIKIRRYKFRIPECKIAAPAKEALLCLQIAISAGRGSNSFAHPELGDYHLTYYCSWRSELPTGGDMTFYFPIARSAEKDGVMVLEQLHYDILSGLVVKNVSNPETEEGSSSDEESFSVSESDSLSESISGSESTSASESVSESESCSDDTSSSADHSTSRDESSSDDESQSSSSCSIETETPPVGETPSAGDGSSPDDDNPSVDTDGKAGFYVVDQFIYSDANCTGDNEGLALSRVIVEYPYHECQDVYDGNSFMYSLHTVFLLGPYPTYEEAEYHRADPV